VVVASPLVAHNGRQTLEYALRRPALIDQAVTHGSLKVIQCLTRSPSVLKMTSAYCT
jgi:hypothetical protein